MIDSHLKTVGQQLLLEDAWEVRGVHRCPGFFLLCVCVVVVVVVVRKDRE